MGLEWLLCEDLLNNDKEGLKYIEAKKMFVNKVNDLKKIEKRVGGSFIFSNHKLSAKIIINRINQLNLKIRNCALHIDEYECIEKSEKGEIKIIKNYFIPEKSKYTKNSEMERLEQFIAHKEEMIKELINFCYCFNEVLNKTERKVIYYTHFKDESNMKLSSVRLKYCITSICHFKKQATLKLVEQLMCEKL